MQKYMSGDPYLFIVTLVKSALHSSPIPPTPPPSPTRSQEDAQLTTKELENWIKDSKLPVTQEDEDVWECVRKNDLKDSKSAMDIKNDNRSQT